jgi:uncharacterized 2Fe-2S/4Fe-4S cluster protein (DUF4445 family)
VDGQVIEIRFLPDDVTKKVSPDSPLDETLDRASIALQYPCGRRGRCGKCKVRFTRGAPEPTAEEIAALTPEDLTMGWRLACLARQAADATVHIPEQSRLPAEGTLLTTIGKQVAVVPEVRKLFASLERQTIQRQPSDLELLLRFLHEREVTPTHISLSALESLPETLRRADYKVTAVVTCEELIAIEPGNTSSTLYGVAIDIGTTTIAAALCDLVAGREMAKAAALNPQAAHGADVISRIHYASQSRENRLDLRTKVAGCVNRLIQQMCERAGVSREHVYHVVAAGNTVMTHLLLGIPPEHIGLSPYVAVLRQGYKIKASAVGIEIHPEGFLRLAPAIGGFVGGDVVADALVAEVFRDEKFRLLIDIGTNGEVIVGNAQRRLATSAAAGPAFEGAQIEKGMRADVGAIDRAWIDGELKISTIGDAPPVGICGSGLVDLVAELLAAGVIDRSGRIVEPKHIGDPRVRDEFSERIELVRGNPRIRITDPAHNAQEIIYLTQKDIREVQLAKAAIATAIEVLLQEAGVEATELEDLYIAGAFGNYIRPDSAQRIGLIPALERKRIVPLGNAALEGARLLLLNRSFVEAAEDISRTTHFIELAARREFQEIFARNINFPGNPNSR